MSRVLVLAPAFHGYGRRDRPRPGPPRSQHHRARVRRPRRPGSPRRGTSCVHLPAAVGSTGRQHPRRVTAACARSRCRAPPDVVVVVKGDLLGEAFWEALDAAASRASVALRRAAPHRWYHGRTGVAVGPVASYSPLDVADADGARASPLRHLPLAFDPIWTDAAPSTVRRDEVTRSSARATRAASARCWRCSDARLPVRAYGRDWSGHPVDRLRTWRPGADPTSRPSATSTGRRPTT